MQKLTTRHGAGTVLRALRFVNIRTRTFAETQSMADEITVLRGALKERQEAWLDARETRVAGFAVVTWRDDELDDAVMRLSRAVLATVDGDRSDPRWRRLFSAPPSTALKAIASPTQGLYVQSLLAGLRSQPEHPWPGLDQAIRAASSNLERALAERDAAAIAEAAARAELDIALDSARRFYNQLYPRALVALDGQASPVESLFAKLRRKRTRVAPEVAALNAAASSADSGEDPEAAS